MDFSRRRPDRTTVCAEAVSVPFQPGTGLGFGWLIEVFYVDSRRPRHVLNGRCDVGKRRVSDLARAVLRGVSLRQSHVAVAVTGSARSPWDTHVSQCREAGACPHRDLGSPSIQYGSRPRMMSGAKVSHRATSTDVRRPPTTIGITVRPRGVAVSPENPRIV